MRIPQGVLLALVRRARKLKDGISTIRLFRDDK